MHSRRNSWLRSPFDCVSCCCRGCVSSCQHVYQSTHACKFLPAALQAMGHALPQPYICTNTRCECRLCRPYQHRSCTTDVEIAVCAVLCSSLRETCQARLAGLLATRLSWCTMASRTRCGRRCTRWIQYSVNISGPDVMPVVSKPIQHCPVCECKAS